MDFVHFVANPGFTTSSILKGTYRMGIGFPEMMVVLVIALIIFGPSKLPKLGEGLGKAIRNFKQGMREGVAEQQEAKKIEPTAKG